MVRTRIVGILGRRVVEEVGSRGFSVGAFYGAKKGVAAPTPPRTRLRLTALRPPHSESIIPRVAHDREPASGDAPATPKHPFSNEEKMDRKRHPPFSPVP